MALVFEAVEPHPLKRGHKGFFLFHTVHANFGFIDVQYLQNGVFSFEKGLNGQNHS